MKASEKLIIAKELLELNFSNKISQISIDLTYKQLHIVLIDGIHLYIVYNDHGEYSYSIIFSKLDLDRCRFDNYDDHWKVSSRPHHFHPRKIISIHVLNTIHSYQSGMQNIHWRLMYL